jgi:ABC-type tungstate transport system permease subunit
VGQRSAEIAQTFFVDAFSLSAPGAGNPNVKKELGQQFIDYLVSPQGQKDIANYKIDGVQLFYPNADDAGA